jgi:Zn-dependent peptidase ImmA (M78 family)/predicted secreted protein
MRRRSLSPLDRARARGSEEAARQHAQLKTDQTRPIDVFGIVEQSGIWLMFQPLRSLYGAYMREGAVPGIIVNSNHPLSVRRFTAAHEYGHHVLGHAPKVDDERNLNTQFQGIDPDEAAAQAFAANFLMPLQLVNTMLRQMGLPLEPGEMSPGQVYLLSLNLGSSYPATINQLLTFGKIKPEIATALRKAKPKDIKTTIGRGQRPPRVWADAWQVEADETGKTLYPKVEDVLHVALPETPSTGYVWSVDDPEIIDATQLNDEARANPPDAFLSMEGSSFEGSGSDQGSPNWQDGPLRFGTGGTRHLVFRALRPGEFTLRLQKRRPWERASDAETFAVDLRILQAGTGGIEQGLSPRQWPWLQAAA